jgi:N-acetyltransferase 10
MLNSLSRGKSASGDLIPWTIAQQFQDHEFGSLSGARIVRIATHPNFQRMGYGRRAMELLQAYYEGKRRSLDEIVTPQLSTSTVDPDSLPSLKERLTPRTNLAPLLLRLEERPPEQLNYIGVSYGVTNDLLKFWKRFGMVPVYICQKQNELTGEHTCIMLKTLNDKTDCDDGIKHTDDDSWLMGYWTDFRRRFVSLLGYDFRTWHSSLALSVLHQAKYSITKKELTKDELDLFLSPHDLNRREKYAQNMIDYHMVMDLLPTLARLFFLHRLDVSLNELKSAILLSFGLQYKSVETLSVDLNNLAVGQILGIFNQLIRQIQSYLSKIQVQAIEKEMVRPKEVIMLPVTQSLNDDLAGAAREVDVAQKKATAELFKKTDLSLYAIRGTEDDWQDVLNAGPKGIVSVKSTLVKKRQLDSSEQEKGKNKKKRKHSNFNKEEDNGKEFKKFKKSSKKKQKH